MSLSDQIERLIGHHDRSLYLLGVASIGTDTWLEGLILPGLPHSRRPIFHYVVGSRRSSIFAEKVILLRTVGKTPFLASVGLVYIYLPAAVAFALEKIKLSTPNFDEFCLMQACKLKFKFRDLTSFLCSAAALAVY